MRTDRTPKETSPSTESPPASPVASRRHCWQWRPGRIHRRSGRRPGQRRPVAHSLDADGTDAYRITAPIWILVYKNQTDTQKPAKDVDYASLPAALQQKAVAQIDNILVPAT